MSAGKHDFLIEQGATFEQSLQWQNADGDPFDDLSDYLIEMVIGSDRDCADKVYRTLDTTNGEVVITDGPNAWFKLYIDAVDTETLEWKKAIYDLKLTSSAGKVIRLLEGRVTVSEKVG